MPHIPNIEEQLAAYVDGTLDPTDRAELERALADAPELREQVELARAARTALGALSEQPVPPGTLQPVVRELDRLATGRESAEDAGVAPGWSAGTPSRSRWGLFAAAAAASIVVLAAIVIVPRLDGPTGAETADGARTSEVSGGGADTEGAPAIADRPPVLEQSAQDFDIEALQALAAQTALDPVASGPVPSAEDLKTFAPAIRCVRQWESATGEGTALRVIEATFEGKPSYIGVFRDDDPPAKVIVWAVKRKGCDVLTVTSNQI
ncbi:MAG: zf-HC2 domain-containing protein [Actinomycetota bacterium]